MLQHPKGRVLQHKRQTGTRGPTAGLLSTKMFVKLIIRLSALSMGLSYAGCTTPQQQAQLATLHERMNQMISALYSSPLLSKVQTAASSSEEFPSTTSSQESTYSYAPAAAPAPPVVFVSAPPSFLEAGARPPDYGHPPPTHAIQRSTWSYPYDYVFQQQFAPPAPVYSPPVYAAPTYPPSWPRPQYPEYARAAYPQPPAPQPPPLPPTLPYHSSLPYPPNVTPFPVPACAPTFPGAPAPYPAPVPCMPAYPPSPAPYSFPIPQQYAPFQYPPPVPVPYPPPITMPYSIPYMQPMYPPPAAFPKTPDALPQPQYEYSS